LSLAGFDNSVFARLRALWLTSVDTAALEMGHQAAQLLLARIEHPDAPGQVRLTPPRLEVRGTTGPVPCPPAPELTAAGRARLRRPETAIRPTKPRRLPWSRAMLAVPGN